MMDLEFDGGDMGMNAMMEMVNANTGSGPASGRGKGNKFLKADKIKDGIEAVVNAFVVAFTHELEKKLGVEDFVAVKKEAEQAMNATKNLVAACKLDTKALYKARTDWEAYLVQKQKKAEKETAVMCQLAQGMRAKAAGSVEDRLSMWEYVPTSDQKVPILTKEDLLHGKVNWTAPWMLPG